jgi:integrase
MSYYLRSCKQFCRWLVRDRRHNDNPLVHLQGWNASLDRRHDRRALEREEIAWLLETTKDSTWVYRGLTGLDRFVLYVMGLSSGLRASELASLTPGNFRLAENPPVIHLFAAYAKNQKEVDQPISADLIPVLQDYLACKPADQPVWPGTWVERSARMFRHDLAEARQQWLAEVRIGDDRDRREASTFLAYRDASNLVADFHALRHSFITLLAKSGVTPKLAQSLARHSDINLTMQRYTHVGLHDQAAALKAVPSILPAERQGSPWQEAG